ncbi:MAG: PHP domain-containing protein [Acidimicrobiia bacterium]|nr:PHP domain-containing protein [Acidimicrobiia bacterium]
MDPGEALERIADLLQRVRNQRPKVQAFRRAAEAIRDIPPDELRELADAGRLTDLPGIGASSATVITEALAGKTPSYLENLRVDNEPPTDLAAPVRAVLRGDLHLHSDWSDGGASIEAMARTAAELGHEYLALTDHSPLVRVANGLDAGRLGEQLETLAELNEELAPFRMLAGMEVDIRDDGALDMDDALLARLDVVVASVHSKLDMEPAAMTKRMVTALANPNVDILGHCTGRLVVGKGRAESRFDAEMVFAAAAHLDKAIEVNSRPERLDPPRRLLRLVDESGAKISIDSDAHATWQLGFQSYGCHRVAEAGIALDRIVNSWPVDDLLAWTASHTNK